MVKSVFWGMVFSILLLAVPASATGPPAANNINQWSLAIAAPLTWDGMVITEADQSASITCAEELATTTIAADPLALFMEADRGNVPNSSVLASIKTATTGKSTGPPSRNTGACSNCGIGDIYGGAGTGR